MYSQDEKGIHLFEQNTFAYSTRLKSGSKEIVLLVQGSYANNTNIRTYSDVDVAVILESTFITEYRAGVGDKNYGFSSAEKTTKTFKDRVEDALVNKFGREKVTRKDKSIKIDGTSYRVDADSVPALRYRDYRKDSSNNSSNYIGGIQIKADSGDRIVNYPEQHIVNGRKKNVDTNYLFKKHVRIIKKMREVMNESGYFDSDQVFSFVLESLIWNIPDDVILKYNILRYGFDESLRYLRSDTSKWYFMNEVNGIKSLFDFDSDKLLIYKAFLDKLASFYEYDV